MASSIVRWIRIGIVSDSVVKTIAQASPSRTSRHCDRQRG
jgi:hypothetical protein